MPIPAAGAGPYVPGAHGGEAEPCYPSASCDPGLHCTSAFICALDPGVAGANAVAGSGPFEMGGSGPFEMGGSGPIGSGGSSSVAGGPPAGGAPPVLPPFCALDAVPYQFRAALPFTVTDVFIGSGWQGNTTTIAYGSCAPGDRAPGAFGACNHWTYTPSGLPNEYGAVAYVRMWDIYYTHPPVCLADGVAFVNFYAKGALGGESVVFAAQGSSEIEFSLTNDWQQYQIPMAGVIYNTDLSGVELGFYWRVASEVLGQPTPTTSFQVDSIRWVPAPMGGAAGSGGGGASSSGGADQGGAGGSGGDAESSAGALAAGSGGTSGGP
jgi:hypothetical protein